MKKYQLLIILLGAFSLNAQNATTIYAGAGFKPQSPDIDKQIFLNNEAGFHVGLFVPFVSKRNFSFGLNLSGEYFSSGKNSYDEYFSYDLYDADYSVSKDPYSKSWQKLFLGGIGPQFNLNFRGGFSVSPIISFGYSYFSQNEFRIREAVEHYDSGGNPVNFTKEIFYQEKVKNNGFFWTPRVRLAYAFSDDFSLWAEANMSFYNYKVKQTELIPYETPPMQNGQYSWTQLIEGHYEINEESFSNNSIGFNIGLAYHFGRRKVKDVPRDKPLTGEKTTTPCRATMLSDKNRYKTYFIKKGEFPVLEWENEDESVTDYEVKIYKTNKPIFEKDSGNWLRTNKPFFEKDSPDYIVRTKNKSIKTDKKLQKIFETIPQNKIQDYAWTVTTYYKDCPPRISGPGNVKMSKNNIGIDVTEIECDGYTTDGKAKYIIQYNLVAMPGNGNNWLVSSISAMNGNTGATIQTHPFSPVQNLPPNTTQSYTINIEVPVGVQDIALQANGTLGAGAGSVSSGVELPNCVCDICNEWEISSGNDHVMKTSLLLRLFSNLQIQNSEPIKSVKAEIVSVQINANKPECVSCTSQDNQMGLFSTVNPNLNSIAPANLWAVSVKDSNGDKYANAIYWDAQDSASGVDFSAPRSIMLAVSLPAMSSLSCCESNIKICVRYTFTDIDCKTCDYLVCYEYTSGTDNGSPTDGTHDFNDPVEGIQNLGK